jgi:hypothetical protein
VVKGNAADYGSIYAVLRELRPDIVLVSEERAEDELQAINAIGSNVARLRGETEGGEALLAMPPLLLVSGETGKAHLAKYFDRALRYYSSLWHTPGEDGARSHSQPVRFPSPFMPSPKPFSAYGDPIIDVLDDPAERLVGIIRSYLDPRRSVPVELNFCDPDTPGMMAGNLAALAGYHALAEESSVPRPQLSFANTRLIARPGNKFIVKGFAYLDADAAPFVAGAAQRTFCRLGVVAGHQPPEAPAAGALLFVRPDGEAVPADVIKDVQDLFGGGVGATEPSTYERQLQYCCGMPNCPVEAFNKVSAGIFGVPPAASDGGRAAAHQRLAGRFRIGTYQPTDRKDADDRAFAHFRLTCAEEGAAGAFAIALHALLCTRLVPMSTPPEFVFNLTYISSYECHDERFGVFTCYGRRTPRFRAKRHTDVADPLTAADVIEELEIFPIRNGRSGASPWQGYAQQVADFLNRDAPPGRPFRAAASGRLDRAESIVVSPREPEARPGSGASSIPGGSRTRRRRILGL